MCTLFFLEVIPGEPFLHGNLRLLACTQILPGDVSLLSSNTQYCKVLGAILEVGVYALQDRFSSASAVMFT